MADKSEDLKVKLSAEGVEQVLASFKKIQAEEKKLREETKKLSSDASLATFKKQLSGVKDLLMPSVGAFSFVAIVAGFQGLVKEANAFAKSMGAVAKMTGYSTQEMSVWGYAAKKMGKDFDDLKKPLVKSAQFIGQVNLGDKGARSSVAQLFSGNEKALDGMSQDQQLEKLVKRMAELGPSAERTAMAMKMFGKSGAEILPFMDKFGKNLDEMKQKAADAGLIVGPELAASISQSQEALKEMHVRSLGVAMQFSSGLMPALAKASKGLVAAASAGGEVGGGFKILGSIIGAVAKGIVSAFIILGQVVGTVLAGLWVGLQSFIGRFGQIVEDIKGGRYWQAAKGAMAVGTGAAFVVDMAKGLTTSGVWNGFGAELHKSLSKIWDDSVVDPKLLEEAVVPKIGKEKAAKAVKDWTDEILRAKKAAALAQVEAEKLVQDELAKLQEDEAKRQFELGKLSVDEFYRGRREALLAAQGDETKALSGKYAAALGVQNVSLSRGELLDAAQGSLATLQSQSLTGKDEVDRLTKIAELSKLIGEIKKTELEDQKKLLDLERQLAEAKYKSAAAEMQRSLELVKLAQEAEERKYQRGEQSRFQTDQNINNIGVRNMPVLREQLQGMKDAAVTPEQVRAVEEMARAIREWGQAAAETNVAMQQLKGSIADMAVQSLTQFWMDLASAQMSVGDAAMKMAQSFVSSLLQMITQAIMMKIVFTAMGMPMPAGSLASAFSTGGAVQKKADGGAIFGPGTGTSDSIPALLSNGEHVITAAEVRAAGGHDAIYAIRSAIRSTSRYAEGGAVGSASGAALSMGGASLEVTHDPDLILRRVDTYLSGPGMKTIIKSLPNNKKAFKQGLT